MVKIIGAIEKVADQLERAENTKNPKNRGEIRRHRGEVAGLWIAAAVGACAILVGNRDASEQRGVMERQREAIEAQLTAMKNDQRPWIGMSSIENTGRDPVVGFDYGFSIANVGKSPAFDVSWSVQDWNQPLSTPHIPHEKCTSDCIESTIVMIPGGREGVRIPILGQTKPKVGEVAWIIARVDYRDSDNKWHKTGICFTAVMDQMPSPPGQFRYASTILSCHIPESNYAD